ncbi:FecR domain-containing protein [Butyrivibrio sp. AE2032]|uniref:FecR domain-containing protein n=1 Tax=Butyrivibrio sp. AE2032 TaxID=1458463 RepID=UPI00054ECDCB|nr:FecR domain-containing protein [Butyrivibrio sp. AE2032]
MGSRFVIPNKQFFLKLSCYFIVLVLMALSYSIPVSAKNNRDISISITKGTCQIERSGKILDAQNNMSINSGDTIRSSENSLATIKLDSDKFLYLVGPTEIEIQAKGTADNSQTSVFVKRGIMATDVKNKLSEASYFYIYTPNTAMSIRGTKTLTEVYEDVLNEIKTNAAVVEGQVEFSVVQKDKNGNTVTLSLDLNSGLGQTVVTDVKDLIDKDDVSSFFDDPKNHGNQSSGNTSDLNISSIHSSDIMNGDIKAVLNVNGNTQQSTQTTSQSSDNESTAGTASTNDVAETAKKEGDNNESNSHEHTWDGGTITANPTCTQSGIKTYTCTMCGDTRTEEIPALNHDYHENIVDPYPIFDADNNFEQWHVGSDTTECSHCGDVTSQETILVQPVIIDSQNNTIDEISVGSFSGFTEGSTLEIFPVNDALGQCYVASPPYDDQGHREIIDTIALNWEDESILLDDINTGDTLWIHIDLPDAYKETFESDVPIEVVEDSISYQDVE